MECWTVCDTGHVHWGARGAAGFLFRYTPSEGEASYLLQQRSRLVDNGGRWGIPGGAIQEGESPESAARRETKEEIGVLPSYRVRAVEIQDCGGGWKFHLIIADVDRLFEAFCVRETDATGWFTREDMHRLALHPGLQYWLAHYREQ